MDQRKRINKAAREARLAREHRNSLAYPRGKEGELLKFRHNYYSKVVYLDMYHELSKYFDVEGYMRLTRKDASWAMRILEETEADRVIWKHGVTVGDMFQIPDFKEVLRERFERIGAAMVPKATDAITNNLMPHWPESVPYFAEESNGNEVRNEVVSNIEINSAPPSNNELSPEEWVNAGKIAANELQRRHLSRMRSKSASRVSDRPKVSEESVLRSLGEVPRKSHTRNRSKSMGGTRRKGKRRASRNFSA